MEERVMSQKSFSSEARQSPFASWRAKAGALVLGLGLASAGAYAGFPEASGVEAAVAAPATVMAPAQSGRIATEGYADAVAKVTPAVVTIRTERTASPRMTQMPQFPEGFPFGDFFGQRQAPRGRQMPAPMQRGLGSGVIVTLTVTS